MEGGGSASPAFFPDAGGPSPLFGSDVPLSHAKAGSPAVHHEDGQGLLDGDRL
jgi:hypothetical protein